MAESEPKKSGDIEDVKKAVKPRDDFTQTTIDTLAKRAGYRCSVPGCHRLTVGPAAEADKAFNQGTAAHIISASPDSGPRADPSATREMRKSIDNGIWCCGTHGRLIDSDETRYSVELLRQWKKDHEDAIALEASGCAVGRGFIISITLANLGRFTEPQTLRFGSKTLLLGNNDTGKDLIGDMVASLSHFENLTACQHERWNEGRSSLSIEVFSGTKMTWQISISDEIICNADGNPVPTLYSGFKVFHLGELFRPTKMSRSEFGTGDLDNKEEDAAWEKVSNATFLEDLERLTQLPRDGLLTALKVMTLTPGRFFADLKLEGEELLWRVNDAKHFFDFGRLGGAEQQFVVLDLFLRLAEFSARFTPTILILNQAAFPSLDRENLPKLLKKLSELDLQCQLIVPLHIWPKDLSPEGWSIWHLHEQSNRDPVTIRPWRKEED